jgi:two-component SAPR family response regulator
MEAGIEKARETGYRRAESCLLIGKADVLRDLGRFGEALDSYNMGLDIAREVMESYYVAGAKAGLGETYRLLGDTEKAEVLIKEAISQADAQGQGYESALFNTQLAVIEYERGHHTKADRILNDILARLKDIGDKDGMAKAFFHLAQNAFLDKKYPQAIAYLKNASSLADELGYDAFFAVEGRKAVLLMEYAVAKGVSVERFSRSVEKIKLHRIETDRISHNSIQAVVARRPEIEARALGQLSVTLDGQHITEAQWRSVRAKEIFFFLLSSDGAQTRESITNAVWPDLSPAKATSNFHINLYRLRRALHPRIITMEQGRYMINPNLEIFYDALEFEKLIKASDNSALNDTELITGLEKAVSLYKGPFLTEIYSDWAAGKCQRLENDYANALMLLTRLSSKRGQHHRAVGLLEKLMAIDPYQDEVYCQLIEEHLAIGNDMAASGVYKRYVDTMARELDRLPSNRMRSLYKRILTGSINNKN